MHPLHASKALAQLERFRALAGTVRFIGEVGLDGSPEGKASLSLQTRVFEEVASTIQPGSFVTVHSRNAWRETLRILSSSGVGPVCFHYFTGGAAAAETLEASGHYFSVNRRMVESSSRHVEMVRQLPRHRVIVESDAPFLGETMILRDLELVYSRLASFWNVAVPQAIEQVRSNFAKCRTSL
jgi:TatD DNase family protein